MSPVFKMNKISLAISSLLLVGWLMILICLAVSNFSVGFLDGHRLSCGDVRDINNFIKSIESVIGNQDQNYGFDVQGVVSACDISTAWTVFAVLALVFSVFLIITVTATMFVLPQAARKLLPKVNFVLSGIVALTALLTAILSISAYAEMPDKNQLLDSGYAAIPTFTTIGAVLMIVAAVFTVVFHRRGMLTTQDDNESSSCPSPPKVQAPLTPNVQEEEQVVTVVHTASAEVV